jgi:SlyX protein
MTEDERFITLETRVAYLEHSVEELSGVLVEQGREIEKLKMENAELANRERELHEAFEGDIPNRRPPHY